VTCVVTAIEVASVAAEAGSQVPADLISDAPKTVTDRLAGGLAAAAGLIEYVAEIVGERARQGPDVLSHLPELFIPGHIKRLRRTPC
jgi:hypothetical protein